MGIIDEDGFIKQPSQFWELGVVFIAAVFTLCIVGLWFFSFSVPPEKPVNEVSVGLGAGSTIHPSKPVIADPIFSPTAKPHPKP